MRARLPRGYRRLRQRAQMTLWALGSVMAIALLLVSSTSESEPLEAAAEHAEAEVASSGAAGARQLTSNATRNDDDEDPYWFMGGDPFISYPYKKSDNKWAIVLHLIGIGYMVYGLNVVCDAYFCEGLTAMVRGQWRTGEAGGELQQ